MASTIAFSLVFILTLDLFPIPNCSNYQQIQHLGYYGHEIGTESISQQQGLQDKGYEEWVGEMIGMREILRHFANVSANDVVGMRAPFLKPGRNTQYKVSGICYCRWMAVAAALHKRCANNENINCHAIVKCDILN